MARPEDWLTPTLQNLLTQTGIHPSAFLLRFRTLWSGSNPWTCTEQKTPTDLTVGIFYSGAPRRIRTLNLLIRSQMLYPIEPWAQRSYILYIFITIARKNNYFLSAAATVPIRPMIHHIKVLATNRFIITVAHRDLRAGTHDIAIRIKT